MTLFPDFQRTYNKRADHRQSSYQFLNESTWKAASYVRNLVQEWSLIFPLDADFVKRFTSTNDQEHLAAFFEMVIFQWLKHQDFDVDFHALASARANKRPDFSVSKYQKSLFVAECTLSAMPNNDLGIAKLKAHIKDVVESVRCDQYWILLEFQKCSNTSLSKRKLIQFIEMVIKEGQRNAGSSFDRTEWTMKESGWELIFSLAPKSIADRTLGMTIEGPAQIINSERPLRTALDRKRGRNYGSLEIPYIICINSNDIYLDELSIMRALFGRWSHATGFHIGRFGNGNNDGFLVANDNPQNTSVSAVLIAKGLVPWNLHVCKTSLWHNPWAKCPLNEVALDIDQFFFQRT